MSYFEAPPPPSPRLRLQEGGDDVDCLVLAAVLFSSLAGAFVLVAEPATLVLELAGERHVSNVSSP